MRHAALACQRQYRRCGDFDYGAISFGFCRWVLSFVRHIFRGAPFAGFRHAMAVRIQARAPDGNLCLGARAASLL